MLIRFGGHLDASITAGSASWLEVLDNVAALALPFLLIVNFAQLLNAHDSFRNQLIVNAAAMVGICGLYYLVFYAMFIVGFVASLSSLLNIMALIFSRIPLDILKEIIRKTYTVEIITPCWRATRGTSWNTATQTDSTA